LRQIHNAPSFETAMKGEYRKEFQANIANEYPSLEETKVFKEVEPLPTGFTALFIN
jgi:hypothetical protein